MNNLPDVPSAADSTPSSQSIKKRFITALSVVGLDLRADSPPVEKFQNLAASVARCEAVLEYYKNQVSKVIVSRTASEEDFDKNVADKRRLLSLMQEDKALSFYVNLAEGEPELALVLAKAEVKKLETMRSLGWEPPVSRVKTLGKLLIVPGLLIALTAWLGNWVGSSLQEAAFHRNRAFEYKLALLQKGQDKASDWLVEATTVYYSIDGEEYYRKEEYNKLQGELREGNPTAAERVVNFNAAGEHILARKIEQLQSLLNDLDKMSGVNQILDKAGHNQIIGTPESTARNELLTSIGCLQKKREDLNWNNVCSDKFQLPLLMAYRDSFSDANVSLLNEK